MLCSPASRSQIFTKERPGEARVRETVSALAEGGELQPELTFAQGACWSGRLPLRAALDPTIERWYREDQVMNVVRSDPLRIDRVSELGLIVTGELADVFDGSECVVAV